jgi:hypothetical protein
LPPQVIGSIALGDEAPGSPQGRKWDGVALTLFVDRGNLQFTNQEVPKTPPAGAATSTGTSATR